MFSIFLIKSIVNQVEIDSDYHLQINLRKLKNMTVKINLTKIIKIKSNNKN